MAFITLNYDKYVGYLNDCVYGSEGTFLFDFPAFSIHNEELKGDYTCESAAEKGFIIIMALIVGNLGVMSVNKNTALKKYEIVGERTLKT